MTTYWRRGVDGLRSYPRNGRNDGLDLLRATGAALVFATHLWAGWGIGGPASAGGAFGIYIFFPLSGFLLYRPFAKGQVDLRRYAVSRAARLLPGYYLALIGAWAAGLIPGLVAHPLPVLTMTQNTFALDATAASGFGQSWTLGVELLFYVALPLLALLPGRVLLGVMGGALVIGLAAVPGEWLSRQLPAQLWAFGLGMLVARYRFAWFRWAWPLGVGLIAWGVLRPAGMPEAVMVAVGAAILIGWSAEVRPSIPWARWPADISYGVYLWHMTVIVSVSRLGLSGAPLLIVAVLGTIAVASASWFLWERPILRLLRHDDPVRNRGVDVEPAGRAGLRPAGDQALAGAGADG